MATDPDDREPFLIPVDVSCRSGRRADEEPIALEWLGERLLIEDVVDRWYHGTTDPTAPISEYFRVRLRGGRLILLKHEVAASRWYLVESLRRRR